MVFKSAALAALTAWILQGNSGGEAAGAGIAIVLMLLYLVFAVAAFAS